MIIDLEKDYWYGVPMELIERTVAMLLRDSNLGGKLLVGPCSWQNVLIEFSKHAPAAVRCEQIENSSVILLSVCGQVLKVIAVPGQDDNIWEFTERRSA